MQAGVTSDTLASAAVGATNVLGTVVAGSIIEGTGGCLWLQAHRLN